MDWCGSRPNPHHQRAKLVLLTRKGNAAFKAAMAAAGTVGELDRDRVSASGTSSRRPDAANDPTTYRAAGRTGRRSMLKRIHPAAGIIAIRDDPDVLDVDRRLGSVSFRRCRRCGEACHSMGTAGAGAGAGNHRSDRLPHGGGVGRTAHRRQKAPHADYCRQRNSDLDPGGDQPVGASRSREFDGLFYSVQAVELIAGAGNLTLMSFNIRDGLGATGRLK